MMTKAELISFCNQLQDQSEADAPYSTVNYERGWQAGVEYALRKVAENFPIRPDQEEPVYCPHGYKFCELFDGTVSCDGCDGKEAR